MYSLPFVIYVHRNKVNGKCYIGRTNQHPWRRWRKHQGSLGYNSCPKFKRALDKYGWDNFESEVICSILKDKWVNELEELFIKQYDSFNNGYNSVEIIDGDVRLSEETKKKIGDKQRAHHASLETPVIPINRKEHVLIEGVEHKQCGKCEEIKNVTEFGQALRRWDKLNPYCKSCNIITSNKFRKPYKKLTPEQFKESYVKRTKIIAEKNRIRGQDPVVRAQISKRNSRAIKATHPKTGETFKFESARSAGRLGFNNSRISTAISTKTLYRGYMWEFDI